MSNYLDESQAPDYAKPLFAAAKELREDGDKIIKDVALLTEKTQILNGERGDKTKSKSALRRGDLRPLATLKQTSKRAAGAPTQAEFNALQADVDRLHRMIALMLQGVSVTA